MSNVKQNVYDTKIAYLVDEIKKICVDNKISLHLQFILDQVEENGIRAPLTQLCSFSQAREDDEIILRLTETGLYGYVPVPSEVAQVLSEAMVKSGLVAKPAIEGFNVENEVVDKSKLN